MLILRLNENLKNYIIRIRIVENISLQNFVFKLHWCVKMTNYVILKKKMTNFADFLPYLFKIYVKKYTWNVKKFLPFQILLKSKNCYTLLNLKKNIMFGRQWFPYFIEIALLLIYLTTQNLKHLFSQPNVCVRTT